SPQAAPLGAGGPRRPRARGDAPPPRQELGRRGRADRTGDPVLVPTRTAERPAPGTADARGPARPILVRAGRAGSGVPDVPTPAPAAGGEGGRGGAEGTRAHAGPGRDGRPPAPAASPLPQGRRDEDVREREARGQVCGGPAEAAPENVTLRSRA